MSFSIAMEEIGKMYKLFNSPLDRAIDAFGLSKYLLWKKNIYQEFWALRGINLIVSKGERLGIVGRNGAGKSTLLKLICSTIAPTEGYMKVNGKIDALMELGTGFHPEFTGRENIKASLSYHGLSLKHIKKLEEEIIDFAELEEFIDQPVKIYSSGMYARLAFAVSTVLEPEILIIDEILGVGDASFAKKCSHRMKSLTEETGATVLFVSHSMESVLEICNRAILINKGKIVNDSTPLTISKIYNKMIREEDELLMRARESRIRKKDYYCINSISSEYEIFLFRLATDTKHPKGKHKFFKFVLLDDNEIISKIDVGSPMDNDLGSLNRIVDGPGLMDWSVSVKDGTNFCRIYQDEGGIYCHAPFQLSAPRHILDNKNISFSVKAMIDVTEKVHLDLWNGKNYERIATLSNDCEEYLLDLKRIGKKAVSENSDFTISQNPETHIVDENSDKNNSCFANENTDSSLSLYGSGEIIVEYIELLDKHNSSKRVFVTGEVLKFKITFKSTMKIEKFIIVINILRTDGSPVSQVFCYSHELDISNFEGGATIYAIYSPLRIGAGEYIVSIGFFKEYDLLVEKENEAYTVIDRAIFFKVVQPENMKKALGNFAHKTIWRFKNEIHVYDPTEHYNKA